jgi:hypothetical protein
MPGNSRSAAAEANNRCNAHQQIHKHLHAVVIRHGPHTAIVSRRSSASIRRRNWRR